MKRIGVDSSLMVVVEFDLGSSEHRAVVMVFLRDQISSKSEDIQVQRLNSVQKEYSEATCRGWM